MKEFTEVEYSGKMRAIPVWKTLDDLLDWRLRMVRASKERGTSLNPQDYSDQVKEIDKIIKENFG